LTEKHDGQYLAKVLAACVERYGLEDFVGQLSLICLSHPDLFCADSCTMHGQCGKL
jgi:hypothetical protein